MTSRQVTVGVDGSVAAVRALDRAAEEAVLRGAALDIVYAVPDVDGAGPVLATAVARARGRCPGLPVTALAVPGSPVRALADHGRDAELTVVGTRRLGVLGTFLAGSVSRRLAARTGGPLLVVGGAQGVPEGAVLFWPAGEADLDGAAFAFAEAERRGARLRVLRAGASRSADAGHRVPAPGEGRSRSPRHGRRTSGAGGLPPTDRGFPGTSPFAWPGLPRPVRPVHALVEATRGAVVVVVGARRRGHRPGRVARVLLRHAHCPVVLVPGGDPE
ncbi:universal stress protein [Streptomyces sp. NPDC127038]|uniref:universal stress protein n=1 Tax=Streptomyces sp. NPDC127038 TaxID=3347114 RepID=UPI0036544243